MDNHLEQDALIEDALKTYPLATLPCDLTANVMARIQKNIRPALVTWNDFALSLVIALCVGALLFAVQNLPPIILVKLRIQGILLYQDFLVNARWLTPTVLFGLAAFFSALTIPYLFQMTTDRRR
jgi:hypothetical protein